MKCYQAFSVAEEVKILHKRATMSHYTYLTKWYNKVLVFYCIVLWQFPGG